MNEVTNISLDPSNISRDNREEILIIIVSHDSTQQEEG